MATPCDGPSAAHQVGNRFAISTVPEGTEKTIMRQLARPFAPGEDRLAGLEVVAGELSDAPLLKVGRPLPTRFGRLVCIWNVAVCSRLQTFLCDVCAMCM